jgi:hypothetical protein
MTTSSMEWIPSIIDPYWAKAHPFFGVESVIMMVLKCH